jgi:hypothetical protein
MTEYVVNASGECSDWASRGTGCVMTTNDAASGTVFLVGDFHGCFYGSVECVKWCRVGYDHVVFVVETDVGNSELLGPATVPLSWLVYSPTHRR